MPSKIWTTEGTVELIRLAGEHVRTNQGSIDQLNNVGHDKYDNWATTINAKTLNNGVRVSANQVKNKMADITTHARQRITALRAALRGTQGLTGKSTAEVIEAYPHLCRPILNKNLSWIDEFLSSFEGDPALELNPPRAMGMQHLAPPPAPSPAHSEQVSEQRSQRARNPSQRLIEAQEVQSFLSPTRRPRQTPVVASVAAPAAGGAPPAATEAAPPAPPVPAAAAVIAPAAPASNATNGQPSRSGRGGARASSRSGNGGRPANSADVEDDGTSPDRPTQRRRVSGAPSGARGPPRLGRGSNHETATVVKNLLESNIVEGNEAARSMVAAFERGTLASIVMKETMFSQQLALEVEQQADKARDREMKWLEMSMKMQGNEHVTDTQRSLVAARMAEQTAAVEQSKLTVAQAQAHARESRQRMDTFLTSFRQRATAPPANAPQEGRQQGRRGLDNGGEDEDEVVVVEIED